jgi:hypothetical protein
MLAEKMENGLPIIRTASSCECWIAGIVTGLVTESAAFVFTGGEESDLDCTIDHGLCLWFTPCPRRSR